MKLSNAKRSNKKLSAPRCYDIHFNNHSTALNLKGDIEWKLRFKRNCCAQTPGLSPFSTQDFLTLHPTCLMSGVWVRNLIDLS